MAKKPEVLAPCGGWVQLKAAVENGADCVYFGLTEFNARARAANFTTEELPSVVEYLHARGVKGYVTFNILVFDGELENAERRIRAIARAGVDAVIVQDVGVVELFRRVAPGLPVHGSTQMTITSAEGAEFARQLGVERVVVGRELRCQTPLIEFILPLAPLPREKKSGAAISLSRLSLWRAELAAP